jgi:hypothetical protein
MARRKNSGDDFAPAIREQEEYYPVRSARDVRTLQRLLDVRRPPPGVSVAHPSITIGSGTGWGSALYMRPRYRGRGAKRELHSVWTIPVGLVVGILALYEAERIMVGVSSWWPGSKLTLGLDDFGSWLSKNVIPQGSSITALTSTVTGWGVAGINGIGAGASQLAGAAQTATQTGSGSVPPAPAAPTPPKTILPAPTPVVGTTSGCLGYDPTIPPYGAVAGYEAMYPGTKWELFYDTGSLCWKVRETAA